MRVYLHKNNKVYKFVISFCFYLRFTKRPNFGIGVCKTNGIVLFWVPASPPQLSRIKIWLLLYDSSCPQKHMNVNGPLSQWQFCATGDIWTMNLYLPAEASNITHFPCFFFLFYYPVSIFLWKDILKKTLKSPCSQLVQNLKSYRSFRYDHISLAFSVLDLNWENSMWILLVKFLDYEMLIKLTNMDRTQTSIFTAVSAMFCFKLMYRCTPTMMSWKIFVSSTQTI